MMPILSSVTGSPIPRGLVPLPAISPHAGRELRPARISPARLAAVSLALRAILTWGGLNSRTGDVKPVGWNAQNRAEAVDGALPAWAHNGLSSSFTIDWWVAGLPSSCGGVPW